MTTIEFAEKFGLTLSHVCRMIKTNKIHGAKKIGRDWLIPASEANKFQKALKIGKFKVIRIKPGPKAAPQV